MNQNYYAVIMAGGIGSRLWPISTAEHPKQFHDLLGTGQTLLQKTFTRLNLLIPAENIIVLTNERYLDITLSQLPLLSKSQVILEPAMRNTAPCILMAALKIKKQNPNAIMLVAPSDHWIENESNFIQDVKICFTEAATSNKLITLGITPTFPNTGYGYIEIEKNNVTQIKKVKQFREKPDYETAKAFVAAGNYVWNAGIFIWSVASITKAFEDSLPKMNALFLEGLPIYNTIDEAEFVSQNYPLAENISIDYGIMEKATNVFVKKASFDWNDLGTWGAIHDKLAVKTKDNIAVRANTLIKNGEGNIIFTKQKKKVVIDGLSNYIIVEKEDTLLIYPKGKEQNIKKLVAEVTLTFKETK